MGYQKFLKTFLTIAFIFIPSLAFFNYLIDPYGIFQSPSIPGINEFKTEITKHERLHKKIRISRFKPDAVLLGNSVVVNGFNPDELHQFTQTKYYNAGLGGAPFDEIYANFEHCLASQPKLKKVILGIDCAGFNKHPRPFAFKESKSNSNNELLTGLLSSKSTLDSIHTFLTNLKQKQKHQYNDNGFLIASDLVEETRKKQFEHLTTIVKPFYEFFELDQRRIDLFEQLVEICKKRKIELHVFIAPSHADYCNIIHQAGKWHDFEELKRKLCAIYPVWDFSGFNTVTTTPFVNYRNPLYQDHSHFLPNIGNEIVKMMLFKQNAFQDFGYLLTPSNVEEHLDEIKQARILWVNAHEKLL